MINRDAKASLPRDAQLALELAREFIKSQQLATLVAHPVSDQDLISLLQVASG
ncbi:hypothetical protein KZZ52_27095 [Dactylosporangium sp. AC04546]|uniref:hypothetical protein n=1 Tax=Dactylosporangium sp. AC04546 TaxID=2862460 RepID=UPI001EDE10E6|nr:hypothetical protein [Dactylosporangium sp. AC04546]WVK88933.1 hypothetical protein KZZ52_27095 [Dactylosporangium sp. AC04546]